MVSGVCVVVVDTLGDAHAAVLELRELFVLADAYGFADYLDFDASVVRCGRLSVVHVLLWHVVVVVVIVAGVIQRSCVLHGRGI